MAKIARLRAEGIDPVRARPTVQLRPKPTEAGACRSTDGSCSRMLAAPYKDRGWASLRKVSVGTLGAPTSVDWVIQPPAMPHDSAPNEFVKAVPDLDAPGVQP